MDSPEVKVHIKVGANEFDGEGPADDVNKMFAAWMTLISVPASTPNQPPATAPHPAADADDAQTTLPIPGGNGASADPVIQPQELRRIFSEDKAGDVVFLIPPSTTADAGDAVLLALYG